MEQVARALRAWRVNSGLSHRGWLAVLAIALFGGVPSAQADAADLLLYNCVLIDDQVVPPTGSGAVGGGQFIIDTSANTVDYHVVFTGLTSAETAAHIHGPADPGMSGGVLEPLPAGNPKTGTWNYMEADEADILAGKTYVNVHSAIFPSGEIRGQIVPLNALIDGAQEVPPIATPATGWGTFTINTGTNELNYYIAFSGLSSAEVGAHIHGSVLHGASGGVDHALPAGSPKVGTWNYPESKEAAIVFGQEYVNIHSSNFPAGEIRGQIVPLVTPIDGAQEVPPVATSAAGIGLISFDTQLSSLSYDIRFAGLSSAEISAHIHGFAPPGQTAGVLEPLALGSPKIGVWNHTPVGEDRVLRGLTYINIHSENFPSGEIRGQIQGFLCPPTVAVSEPGVLDLFRLARNFPNPFGTGTTIRFSLTEEMPVRLVLYDAQGRRVRTLHHGTLPAGSHPVAWDGRDDAGRPVASGVYHYVLETPDGTASQRLTVVR
jgi:Cu/Zn superoxide dismutase